MRRRIDKVEAEFGWMDVWDSKYLLLLGISDSFEAAALRSSVLPSLKSSWKATRTGEIHLRRSTTAIDRSFTRVFQETIPLQSAVRQRYKDKVKEHHVSTSVRQSRTRCLRYSNNFNVRIPIIINIVTGKDFEMSRTRAKNIYKAKDL